MYADDHQLYVTGSDYNIASSRLQYQGKLAMSWYRDNFLHANTEKFQRITINPRNIDSDKQTEALQIEAVRSLPTLRKSNYLELK